MHGQQNVKMFPSVITTLHLTLCIEIIAVYFEIRTKHINIQSGQKVEFLNVKLEDTYIN